jgi:hypothetical protein
MTPDTAHAQATVRTLLRINQLCNEFEAEYRAGRTPRLEAFVQAATADALAILDHLLPIEIAYRLRRGERLTPDEFAARFPQFDPARLAHLLRNAGEAPIPPVLGAPWGPTTTTCTRCGNVSPFPNAGSPSVSAAASDAGAEHFVGAGAAEQVGPVGPGSPSPHWAYRQARSRSPLAVLQTRVEGRSQDCESWRSEIGWISCRRRLPVLVLGEHSRVNECLAPASPRSPSPVPAAGGR